MKLFKSLILLIALIFVANIAYAQTSNITTEDSLTIAIPGNYPPLAMLGSDGQATGLLVDIWGLWSQKTGLKVKFRSSNFSETISALKNGDADIHSGLFRSEKREEWMDFSQPIYEVSTSIYYPLGVGDPQTMSDLSYQNVGAVLGSYQEDYLKRNYPDVEVFAYKDAGEMMHGALNGEIRAFVAEDQTVLALQLRAGLLGKFEKIKNPLFRNKIHAGILKGNEELLNLIDEGFNAISTDELIKIEGRYIQDPQKRYYRARSGDIKLTKKEKRWLENHKAIRVMAGTWPPFHFIENDKPNGLALDYVTAIFDKLGLKAEFVPILWADALESISKMEKIDMLPTIARSTEREKLVNITQKYLSFPYVIFTRKDASSIGSLMDFHGKTVAVEENFIAHKRLKKDHPEINLLVVKTSGDALKAVSFGKADGYVSNLAVGSYLIEKLGLQNLKVAAQTSYQNDNQSMGIRKDWPELASMVNKALNAITEEEHRALRKRWLSLDAGAKKQVPLTDEERKWLSSHKTIRLGVDLAYPPFEFIDKKGNYSGMAADYIALISQRLGIDMVVTPGLIWSQVLEKVKKREIDVLPVVASTERRRSFLNFTQLYLTFPTVIMTRKDYVPINGISDFSGKVMAAMKGYYYLDELTSDYPDIKLLLVDTPLEALKAVSFSKADGVVINFAVGAYLTQKNSLLNLKVGADANLNIVGGLRFGVRKDWPILTSILDKALDSITQEEHKKIRGKWVPVGIAMPSEKKAIGKGKARELIVIVIVIFLILSVFGFVAVKALREESVALRFGTRQFRMVTLITLSIFITVVASMSWLALDNIKEKVLKHTQTELEIVLKSTAQRLSNWLDSKRSFMDQLGRDPELVDITESLLAVLREPDNLISSNALQRARDFFKSNQERFGKIGFFIISPDRISIGSMRDSNTGTRNFIADIRPELIEQVFQGEAVFIPPTNSDVDLSDVYGERPLKKRNPLSMFFATPIRKWDGTVIAVLTQRLVPEQEFSRELHFGRMGETGETYAFDRNGLLLSESRFNKHLREIGLIESDQNSILNVEIRDPGGNMVEGYRPKNRLQDRPLTRMAASAIRGESGTDLDGYRDYRGVPVYGSWMWLEPLGFGLTTEIDVKEALSTFHTMRLTMFGVLGIMFFLTIGATLFTLALGERANLSLARARDELEQRVEERTDELRVSQERFELTVRGSGDGLWEYDEQSGEYWFSPQCKIILGYGENELANTMDTWTDRIHPDDLEKALLAFSDHVKYDVLYDVEYRMHTKSGEYRWFRIRGKSLRDEQGRAYRTSGSVTDITEQKKAEEELKQNLKDLERFSKLAVDREERMINLKVEINDLLDKMGGISKYKIVDL